MALPGSVTTFDLTFGPYTDAQGLEALVAKGGKLFPVDPATGKRINLVHIASGQAIVPADIQVTIDVDGTGVIEGLPHTDNPGLSTVGFAYRVEWRLTSSNRTASPGNKTFAVPQAAGVTVDFDLLNMAAAVPGVLVPVTYGHSAYDLAVANGFVGDQTQWIASLRGPTGPSGTITAATVSGLSVGADPTVTLGGTPSARTFAFGIPPGPTGPQGPMGGIYTYDADLNAYVLNPAARLYIGTVDPATVGVVTDGISIWDDQP